MTKLLIFAQTGNASQALAALGDGVEVVEISSLAEVSAHDRAAVLVLSDGLGESGDLGGGAQSRDRPGRRDRGENSS